MAKQPKNTLTGGAKSAFDLELERLNELQLFETQQADFLTTDGKGVAATADVQFGNQDEEELTPEELDRRRSGRLAVTDLFI